MARYWILERSSASGPVTEEYGPVAAVLSGEAMSASGDDDRIEVGAAAEAAALRGGARPPAA